MIAQVLSGLEAVGHVWTSLSWEDALYREWRKCNVCNRRYTSATDAAGVRGQPAAPVITLTALWEKGVGIGHELLDLTSKRHAAFQLGLADDDQQAQRAAASQVMIIRHGRVASTQPAIDAPGILGTLEIDMSDLPPVHMGPPTPIWRFKARLSRSIRDRLSAWEAELRTAISDQMTERLEMMAETPGTPQQMACTPGRLPGRGKRWCGSNWRATCTLTTARSGQGGSRGRLKGEPCAGPPPGSHRSHIS